VIHTIYIEQEVAEHPRTRAICDRFPQAAKIPCHHYGEIFNRKAQNFRLQKQRPALILAKKYNKFVLPTPEGYGIGGRRNFYFSHMLNCLYDCRYCFLQGMYRSAYYLLFVNYEDFQQAIHGNIKEAPDAPSYFFSGYDCDSLALEPVTHFAGEFLPFFSRLPNAWVELRTKSTQIRTLLERDPVSNCVVAFSLSPEEVARALEHKAPPLTRRLAAMARLQRKGWRLGLRFDPLIYQQDFKKIYGRFFATVFAAIDAGALHSVSLGSFRLPRPFYHNMVRLYPREGLFAGPLEDHGGMMGYPKTLEQEMVGFCAEQLLHYVPEPVYFPCTLAN